LEGCQPRRSNIADTIARFLCYQPAPHHHQFYQKWEETLLDELRDARNAQAYLWLSPVKKRVQSGRAVAGMKVISINEQICIATPITIIVEFAVDAHDVARSSLAVSTRVMLTRHGVPPIVSRGGI
jgi:hypothetical protein